MFLTLTEIGKLYNISAIKVGKLLYKLGVRDPNHPIKKGFPYEQYILHKIAHAQLGKDKEVKYYTYDIHTIKDEFEVLLQDKQAQTEAEETDFILKKLTLMEVLTKEVNNPLIEEKLQEYIKDIRYHIHKTNLAMDMPLNEKALKVYEQLRTYRKHKSKILHISAFLIFTNTVLHHLSFKQPETVQELQSIK